MPETARRNILSVMLTIGALLPLACAAAFYAFVIRTRIEFGFWPHPYHPDPKSTGFVFHVWAVVVLHVATLVISIPWIAGFLFKVREYSRLRSLALLTPWMVYLALMWLDPFRFIDWFLD
jgi:hypothetical protein